MTTKGTDNTDRTEERESGHPSSCDEMARMMENCGCGAMMTKMMAACRGAGNGEEAAPAEGKESQGTE